MFFFINEKQKLPDENFSLLQQLRGTALRLDGCLGVIAVAEVSAALQPQCFETRGHEMMDELDEVRMAALSAKDSCHMWLLYTLADKERNETK